MTDETETDALTFESKEDLARHLLNEILPECDNFMERMKAAVMAADGAEQLWNDGTYDPKRLQAMAVMTHTIGKAFTAATVKAMGGDNDGR